LCELFVPLYHGDAPYLLLGRLVNVIKSYGDNIGSVTVLVLNVRCKPLVKVTLELYVLLGIISRFHFVDTSSDRALSDFHLTAKDLGRSYPYSIGPYTAISMCKSQFMVYNTGDVMLHKGGGNWISSAMKYISQHESVVTACPVWNDNLAEAESECHVNCGKYGLGFGFSDQLFLCKPDVFMTLSQKEFHPASARYPDYVADGFERRIDSVMRNNNLLRYVDFSCGYCHESFPKGWKRRLWTMISFSRLSR
jgi:hypothetical protein